MDLVRFNEANGGGQLTGNMHSIIFNATDSGLSYEGRPVHRIIITSEKQRRTWEPVSRFYTYDEIHPKPGQRGIAMISTFRVDDKRNGRLTLVITPDPEQTTGNYARIAGQFEFTG